MPQNKPFALPFVITRVLQLYAGTPTDLPLAQLGPARMPQVQLGKPAALLTWQGADGLEMGAL